MAVKLGTGRLNRELPMNLDAHVIALGNQGEDFGFQFGQGRDATLKAEPC